MDRILKRLHKNPFVDLLELYHKIQFFLIIVLSKFKVSYCFIFFINYHYFRYNINYGRLDATDVDIINAARGADIHERILTFPDGYDTEACYLLIRITCSLKLKKTL